MRTRLSLVCFITLSAACSSPRERARDRARADSAVALAAQQRVLMDKLTAQRDSVSRVLGDANMFIGRIDSSISRVKGLAAKSSPRRDSESGLEDQLRARKDMLRRVDALVARARETAREVSALKDQQALLLAENGKLSAENQTLRDSLAASAARVAELLASIEKQAQTIASLETRLDGLGKELSTARAAVARAYYVIGTEEELIKKGVVVKEGGANLLIRRIGRTLVPARTLPQEAFTAIDTREVHEIVVPDTSRRYQIVSRQNLDDAKVSRRDGTAFHGPLEIPEAERFWATSRYLIIVQR
jgi:regulator of replication initiation timing